MKIITVGFLLFATIKSSAVRGQVRKLREWWRRQLQLIGLHVNYYSYKSLADVSKL